MKGIIIIDVPVIDTAEIDEYGMTADLKVYPTTLTDREELTFELKNIEVRPMPERKCEEEAIQRKVRDLRFESGFCVETVGMKIDEYAKGFNACIDEILGEEE